MARLNALAKVGIAAVVIAGLGFVFVRSVVNTRSKPYTVDPAHLRRWNLALQPAAGPTDPMLVLQLPRELAVDLSHQVFGRAGESLFQPTTAVVPLILQGEFERTLARTTTPEELLAAARAAGLEALTPLPRCLAISRVSVPGMTRQVYFVLFDAPAVSVFRRQIAGSGGFDPDALSPLMFVAASNPAFGLWLPLRADPQKDCVAPVVTRTT